MGQVFISFIHTLHSAHMHFNDRERSILSLRIKKRVKIKCCSLKILMSDVGHGYFVALIVVDFMVMVLS